MQMSCVPFQFPPMVTSCKTIAQYHNYDSDIDLIKIWNMSVTERYTSFLRVSFHLIRRGAQGHQTEQKSDGPLGVHSAGGLAV